MTFATALSVWGFWALRRSFSITVEARELIDRGPYRWVRHPVYAGEILSATVVVAWRFSALNLAILIAFIAIQLTRAHWEEKKLAAHLPGYAEFAARTWWLWTAARAQTGKPNNPG